MRRISRRTRILRLTTLLLAVPVALVLLFRVLPPPVTILMLVRLVQGEGLHKDWQPLSEISPDLARAVIAAEDAKFCRHHGFDWAALSSAVEDYLDPSDDGGAMQGGSTISQQTAKNVFLWPSRDIVRKGMEAGFTVLIEGLWGKQRILEVYLNVIEMGPGIYGAESAAEFYFHKPASELTQHEAAALASILPSPRKWSPIHPSAELAGHIRKVESRMADVPFAKGRVCP